MLRLIKQAFIRLLSFRGLLASMVNFLILQHVYI